MLIKKGVNMPNWCDCHATLEGPKEQVKALYDLMKRLEKMSEPLVQNDFGSNWLGCLVHAVGKDWEQVRCRGEFSGVDIEDDGSCMSFSAETAWDHQSLVDTLNVVCEYFPGLKYYFIADEVDENLHITNDKRGKYYDTKYFLSWSIPGDEDSYGEESFTFKKDVYKFISELAGKSVRSETDIRKLNEEWGEDGYIELEKYAVYEYM